MRFLTKKQFADSLGWASNKLSVYIGRGQVVVGGDGLIDAQNEKNKAFAQKYKNAAAAAGTLVVEIPAPKAVKAAAMVGDAGELGEDADLSDDEIPAYDKSEKKLKYLDTLKREKEVVLLGLKEEKLKGEVIPSELIKPLILQHNQSITTAFKNSVEEIIRMMAKKKGFSPAEVADMRGFMVQAINTGLEKATAASITGIKSIISDYAAKKGVGERN